MIIFLDNLPYPLAMSVFWSSIILSALAWAVVAVSVVWAPFGALICALIARRGGMSPRRCAVAGAIYSVLFFLPWVYFAARMLGWSVPKPLVVLGCVVIYAAWLQSVTQFSYIFGVLDDERRMLWTWLFNIAMTIASMALIIRKELRTGWLNPYGATPRRDSPARDALPNPAYLTPFAGFLCGTSVQFALLWADGLFGQ